MERTDIIPWRLLSSCQLCPLTALLCNTLSFYHLPQWALSFIPLVHSSDGILIRLKEVIFWLVGSKYATSRARVLGDIYVCKFNLGLQSKWWWKLLSSSPAWALLVKSNYYLRRT